MAGKVSVRRDAKRYADFIRSVVEPRGIILEELSPEEVIELTFTDSKAGLGITAFRESKFYADSKAADKANAERAEADRKAAIEAKKEKRALEELEAAELRLAELRAKRG